MESALSWFPSADLGLRRDAVDVEEGRRKDAGLHLPHTSPNAPQAAYDGSSRGSIAVPPDRDEELRCIPDESC